MVSKIRNLLQKLNETLKSKLKLKKNDPEESDFSEETDTSLENLSPLRPRPEDEEDYTATGHEAEINLNESKLSFRDRLQAGLTTLKDKVNRIDFRKFKSPPILADADEDKSAPARRLNLPQMTWNSSAVLQKLKTLRLEIFAPKNRNAIHKGFQYAVIFGTVFILGKSLALYLKGSPGQAPSAMSPSAIRPATSLTAADLNQIKESQLFKTDTVQAVEPVDTTPVIAQDIKCHQADRKSRLPIKLLNTVVLQDSVKSIASVQVRSERDLTEVREGDTINGMAEIGLIDRQKIIVKNLQDGNCEVIENSDAQAPRSSIAVMSPSQSKAFKRRELKIDGIENEGNTYTIEKSFIQDKMKNISDVLTQARGIQMTNPDGTLSFKIVEVEPGGIFSYLGIQNEDVITHINGKKIQNLNEVMSLFGKISNVNQMKITVNRNGEQVPLDYNIR